MGTKALLASDGITPLTSDERRELLNSHPDFMAARPIVQEQIEKCVGWTVLFLPKYHCELNPIELLWCTVSGSCAVSSMALSAACELMLRCYEHGKVFVGGKVVPTCVELCAWVRTASSRCGYSVGI